MMKIKNIQQYRKIFKEEIRKNPDRDENFIGNFYIDQQANERRKGWFDLYFGDTDGNGSAQNGVENKLKSFLDMARDGQAIYEFLQNAVDAGGSRFLMFFKTDDITKEDYLLVINNGEMFSSSSIRSILNIGSSTKTNNSEQIGQFGIGFKLAHRLVGKDNAASELIHNLNGPILYSWKNNEINFLESSIEVTDIAYDIDKIEEKIEIHDDYSWLFKILLTTFPCAVNEKPLIWDGKLAEHSPFSSSELEYLVKWLKQEDVKEHIKDDFEEGALFLMKLGEGKLKEIKDEPNLIEGVRFSLAVLKETTSKSTGLHSAVINGKRIDHPELQFHKLVITKEQKDIEDYTYVRFGKSYSELSENDLQILNSESDIQVLFGFKESNQIDNYFKAAPSFYLFFPVSQEVHNFNYILHSNALYKGSSRVFLQSGGGKGLNERLFSKIIGRLYNELTSLFSSDLSRFRDLYFAFLTSGETQIKESTWITESYTKPLNELLKRIIPVKNPSGEKSLFNATQSKETVYFIDTNIQILGDNKYFLFGKDDISIEFFNELYKKLEIRNYNIFDILSIKNSYIKINTWLESSEENYQVFYDELVSKRNFIADGSLTLDQKENLIKVRWIVLDDDTNVTIEEIGNNPIFLLNKNLYTIKDILKKLEFKTSKYDLSAFINVFRNNFQQSEIKQFAYRVLTILFSESLQNNKLETLSNKEKFRVFEVFRTLDETPGERLSLLKLYKNNLGKYQPLGKMVNLTDGLKGLFSIDKGQLEGIESSLLNNYLKVDHDAFYEKLYYPQWQDLLEYLVKYPQEISVTTVINELTEAYNLSNWKEKDNNPLSKHEVLIYGNRVIKSKDILVNKIDLKFDYKIFQDDLEKYFKSYLVDKKFVEIFKSDVPFGYESNLKYSSLCIESLPFIEVEKILKLASVFFKDFFNYNVIIKIGENYSIQSNTKQQYFTENIEIINIVRDILSDDLELLPIEFNDYKELLKIKGYELYNLVINRDEFYSTSSTDRLEKLLEVASLFDFDTRKSIYDKMPSIVFDLNNYTRFNYHCLRFLNLLQELDKNDLQKKIILKDGDVNMFLSEVKPDILTYNLNNRDIEFAKIIPKSSNEKIVFDFYEKFLVKKEFDTTFFKRVFALDGKISNDELRLLFLKTLDKENNIVNIYQFYFIVFSGLFEFEEFNDFYVLNAENKPISINSNMAIYENVNADFFVLKEFLHPKYLDESQLLIDIVDHKELNLRYFKLDKDCNYNVLNKETDLILSEKLQFLYDLFNKTLSENRYVDIEKIDSYLELELQQKVILNQLEYNNETITLVNKWIDNNDKKKEFLDFLNFKFEDSLTTRFINAVLSNKVDFSDIDVNLFKKKDIYMIIKFFLKYEITLPLNNTVLIDYVVKLFVEYFNNKHDLCLIYLNREHCKILDTNVLHDFDYNIIDCVLNQVSLDNSIRLFSFYNIPIKQVEYLFPDKKQLCLEYSLIYEEVVELDEYYYKEWKKTNSNFYLFKGEALTYNVSIDIEDKEIFLAKVSFNDKTELIKNVDITNIYFTSNKSIKSVIECFTLSNNNSENTDKYLVDSLNQLHELYNSCNATFSELLENTEIEEIKEYFQTKIDKEERRVHRDEVIGKINESLKYSTNWFKGYLEFLNTVTEKSNNSEIKILRFSKIEETKTPKFYKLYACNSIIPENIDESRNVKLRIIAGKQKQSLEIKNISQKNQTVLIQLGEVLDETLIKDFFIAEISYFPTIDLLGRLTNAFEHLEEWENINDKFPAIEYIYGPPGTGKTTTLKNRIVDLSKNKDIKILVLAPTNKACDVLAEKLYEDNFYNFLRLSSPTSVKLSEEHYTNELDNITLDSLNVLISTIHRHSYFKVNTDHSQFYLYNYESWDYLIIDEASMINLPYITFSSLMCFQKNNNCKIIIAGDPKQIPPVPELKDEEREEIGIDTENIYSMLGLNSFDAILQGKEVRQIDKVHNLKTQFRSVPEIGNLFSNFAYENQVESQRDSLSLRKLPFEVQKLLNEAVTFLNVPLEQDNQLYSINKLIYSSYHLYSALLVYEFIKYFNRHLEGEDTWSIGVISPYKAQAVLANRLFGELDLRNNLKIYSDTIHGFQGDECDIVFFICNPSSYLASPHVKSLLSNDFIYNVAISRARDYLVIVNPYEKITQNKHINKIIDIHKEANQATCNIIQSIDFEKIIFADSDYINKNTFITNHDDINVYSSDSYKYYVKKNNLSIDLKILNK
ncbi:AAA domain-containing protein [Myroides pelagicus]|uniref:AAA family ATPase n=1 Tax=Myroides pelagicus TaxID=270914 RepID=A0A7K1GSG5_9FLAO|nr:AAA domain-containing protein [Myroides pelagicus]MTH30824.1 AAA family ATPase [Myroides pelagicus]